MIITTTAIAFILLGIGLAISGWGFFIAYRKSGSSKLKSKTGLLLSIFLLISGLANLVIGLGSFLFSDNPGGLFITTIVANFLTALHAVLGLYTVFYIFFPNRSPQFPVILTAILGIAGIVLTAVDYSEPFVTDRNSVDWGMSLPTSLIVFYLLLVSIGSFLYIFSRLFFVAKEIEVRILSGVLWASALVAIVSVFLNFVIFQKDASVPSNFINDIIMGSFGVIFIATNIIVSAMRKSRARKEKTT